MDLIDYLEKGKTITGAYNCELLDRLKFEIAIKRPHSSMITQAKLHKIKFDMVPQPPYSPDLAPSDFYLFPNLERWLTGKRFYLKVELSSKTRA